MKLRGFNNLCYSNEFINTTNLVLKNKDYDYLKDIETCLIKNKDESIADENYLRSMKTMNFKSTNATYFTFIRKKRALLLIYKWFRREYTWYIYQKIKQNYRSVSYR